MDEKTQGNATFQRTVFGPGDAPLKLSNEDGVATLVVGLPERLGPIPARTYWRMSFEFNPPRHLTPAEREAMEDAVTYAANAFLKSLPEDPAAPPVTVSTIGFTTERIVRVSPVPEAAARASEGATFTIEDDGQRYLGVPARIVNGAVEFVVSRALMRTAIEEPTPRQCASSSTASARSRESTGASPAAACATASGEELR